ncbi:MAG TPA: S-methyl-5-thioribose-1-phosphate isomerase [bacterium]|nr:S-methyl-5-thioribose-1-phosphate isomerase [bacterium]
MIVKTVEWKGKHLRVLDQTELPEKMVYLNCRTREQLWEAIKMLRVRGAPLLGVIGSLSIALEAQNCSIADPKKYRTRLYDTIRYIATSRPTAVNLFWGLDRVKKVIDGAPDVSVKELREMIVDEALSVMDEDIETCRKIGDNGAALLKNNSVVLTHCNAGALATAGMGTALAVIYAAHRQGKKVKVFADETRPLLQGSRLTAWELMEGGIDVTLICDHMAASVMRDKGVSCVLVGADRIAANGDTANKIGTYNVAVLAKYHKVPFYVVAPLSTIDPAIPDGSHIPIEERGPEEITHGFGKRTAPHGIKTFSPAFDVTPAELIAGIVTEKGIVRPPFRQNIKKVMK